jgi:hypothetical protein
VRSHPDLRGVAVALLLAASAPSLADTQPVSRMEIDRAAETLKKDPNLASKENVRSLRWTREPKEQPKKARNQDSFEWPEWMRWIGELFSWIGETSRMLMWVIVGVLVALLAWVVIRTFSGKRLTPAARRFIPPTHVQDLDIRPESLPTDIGAAARALWDRGERRAALALLYRGLLSRLVHTYEVPIRDSSTEGDCLTLAARKLDTTRLDYATRLVRTWQRAIYGGLSVDDPVVHELCAQFDLLPQPRTNEDHPGRTGFADGVAA